MKKSELKSIIREVLAGEETYRDIDIKNHPLLNKKVMVKPDTKWTTTEVPSSRRRETLNKMAGNYVGVVKHVSSKFNFKKHNRRDYAWVERTTPGSSGVKDVAWLPIDKLEPYRDLQTLHTDIMENIMKKSELKQLIKECLSESKYRDIESERYFKDDVITPLTRAGSVSKAYKILWMWIKQGKIEDYTLFYILSTSILNFKFDKSLGECIPINYDAVVYRKKNLYI